jgi:hypothetical protein
MHNADLTASFVVRRTKHVLARKNVSKPQPVTEGNKWIRHHQGFEGANGVALLDACQRTPLATLSGAHSRT